ncbi:MAG: hypothetical protein COS65_24755 [Armatimonadetes bacterium CG06_land_8_20_14_3_00_66_21]|nr:MAG: hypothetical protein COS65_24755 [Armatimonadetes bacterium CG06_land_8_20_14_3_00_66_21]
MTAGQGFTRRMRLGGLVLMAAATFTAAQTGGPEGTTLDDFEDAATFARWEFSNGPEFPGAKGSLTRQPEAAHSGGRTASVRGHGAALAFDFTGGGNYVQTTVPLKTDQPATHVRLWIRKPSAHKLTVRATDGEGQTFQKSFGYEYPGWQEVLIALSGWTGNWGGKGDGVFRGAPTRFGLLVENTAPQKTGAVQFDEVRVVTGETAGSASAATEYVATDFRTDGCFRTDTLRYDFSQGATSAGIGTDLSLMGRPLSLSLRARSAVAGHRLKMRIGSHFQGFERVLGELKVGEQVFEAELGGMGTWSHGGGENDGVPRMPLRVHVFSVEKGAGSDKGEVQFLELRCRTEIAPDKAVVLIPAGRTQDGSPWFECRAQSLLPARAVGTLEHVVRDWSGSVVDRGEQPLGLGAGGHGHEGFGVKSDLPYLECEFRYRTESAVYGPVSATVVRRTDDEGDPTLTPESPFGMGLYLYRYPNNAEGFERMDLAAALGQAAGVKWSREEFQWHRLEPEKGKFDWSYYDTLVDTAHRHGISVYGLIAYWSGWAKAYTPEGIADYADFCRALVTHYKDRIKHWEIWNEPNIFFWAGPHEMYADLLKAAYRAIKDADPEAQVLGCSTAGIDRKFIELVMDRGAPFDILTIHPYRGHLDDAAFIKELQDTAALTAKADGKPKPVWITEMGWPTHLNGGVSEREQANLLARSYLCAIASGAAQNVSWYDFREDGANPFYNEHHFGVVRTADLTPKPGYRALATVCRTLAGQTVQERLELGEGLLAYRFAGDGKETVALWSPSGPAVLGLQFAIPPTEVRDLMGSAIELPTHGDLRLVSLAPGSPVFLTGSQVRVTAAVRALRMEAPKAVHPGDSVVVRGEGVGALAGCRITAREPGLDLQVTPREVTAAPDFQVEVRAPADAQPGSYQLHLWLSVGGGGVGVELPLDVIAPLLRV